jgi:dipeptidyl aminopeptidase/acylaminoacyl peptidase
MTLLRGSDLGAFGPPGATRRNFSARGWTCHHDGVSQKLALRLALGLLSIAALVSLFRLYQNWAQDPGRFGTASTVGVIAALQIDDLGQRVVLFGPDGTKRGLPNEVKGATDKDLAWRPDGNQLFFTSDREDRVFAVYRYNFATKKLERRSFGTRNMGNIAWGPQGHPAANADALVTAGGFVLTYDPTDGATRQVLPPVTGDRAADTEGGVGGQFKALYDRFGESFRVARWGLNREVIIAVMRREEGGETLVLQSLRTVEDPRTKQVSLPPPTAVAAGDQLDFDVAPDGSIVVAILGFRFPDQSNIPPQFVRNGRVTPPYRHALIHLNPSKPDERIRILVATPDDKQAFAQPRLSPDGKTVVAVKGVYRLGEGFVPDALVTLDATSEGKGALLVQGEVREPAWDPSGERLAFVMTSGGKRRALYTVPASGGEPTLLSSDGMYANPAFSPQVQAR